MLPAFLIDFADPAPRFGKFNWKSLPGDAAQHFGQALEMRARIVEAPRRGYDLTLYPYTGGEFQICGLRSPEAAKERAERQYRAWIKADPQNLVEENRLPVTVLTGAEIKPN